MFRRAFIILLSAVLVMAMGAAAFAQITNVPDQGVRGNGAITFGTGIGEFSIDVAMSGGVLFGGFKYQEISSNSTTRGHYIYSQKLTGLKIIGNRATITADGYWNGMPAYLTIEVLDDLNMDWFHITAYPKGPILILYDRAGGVSKGDIVVYSTQPVPDAYVKGEGIIAVDKNAGRFQVVAEKSGSAVKGTIYYVEYNPYAMSIVERPKVKIYVPAVTKLVVLSATEAVMAGQGTMNGRPAMVEVRVRDFSMLNTLLPMPDQFYITATPLTADPISTVGYKAGGPLTAGDITIRIAGTIP